MGAEFRLETKRLVLREWRESDIEPMVDMRSDPRVMATLGPVQSREDVVKGMRRHQALQREFGFCSWIAECRQSGEVVGTAGFQPISPGTPAGDAIEIGWKLRHRFWGKGLATEAARSAIDWFFANRPGVPIIAITALVNTRSRRVMDRLGLSYRPDCDFDHPGVPAGSPLVPHVLYRKEPPL